MALAVQPNAAGAATGQAVQGGGRVPFRYATRQRYRPVVTVPVTPGTSTSPPIELKQVGFLQSIDFVLRSGTGVGITTGASAPTLAGNRRWPSSLFSRVQVSMNTGAAVILDLPGEQLEFVNWLLERAYNPNLSTDPDIYAATYNNTSTTNPVNYRLRLPIAANDARDFVVGLILLQSQQVLMQVNVLWNSLSNIFSANPPTLTATPPSLDVAANLYSAPDPRVAQLPPPSLHRILETAFPVSNTGDVIMRLPREGILLRLYIQVVLNGAFDSQNKVNSIKIRLNDVDEPYAFTRQQLKALAVNRYGQTLPNGWYVLDLWHSEHNVAGGDERDVIDTEKFSTTELIVNIDSSATLGAGNNYISVAREIVQFPRRTG